MYVECCSPHGGRGRRGGGNLLCINHSRGGSRKRVFDETGGLELRRPPPTRHGSGGGAANARGGNPEPARTNGVRFLQISPRAACRAPADKHGGGGMPYITTRRPRRCAQSGNTYDFVSTSSQHEASPCGGDLPPARTHRPRNALRSHTRLI